MTIVTRFAPSPTGFLHAGNARTALVNWLLARRDGGSFVLRIEDTDAARSEARHEDALLADLAWLGLDWDAGPDRPDAAGPYRQAERAALHAERLRQLEASGHAYPCWRTESELAERRAEQLARGEAPRFDRDWAQKAPAGGGQPVLRFRVPDDGEVAWKDIVRGRRTVPCRELADFALARSDGTPGFLFANAVDDALMGVTHVLRGEDHLQNTARQILVLRALGLAPPCYGHLPLLAGPEGERLSKRTGASSLADLRAAGILPSALVNYLARLGDPEAEDRIESPADLAARFDPARLSTARPRFDPAVLQHWQHLALAALPVDELAAWSADALPSDLPDTARDAFLETVRPNVERPADVAAWARIVFGDAGLPEGGVPNAAPALFAAALDAFDAHGPDLKAMAAEVRARTGAQGGSFFHPLRAALTGRHDGPGLAELLALMPAATVRARLAQHAGGSKEPSCSSSTTR